MVVLLVREEHNGGRRAYREACAAGRVSGRVRSQWREGPTWRSLLRVTSSVWARPAMPNA